MNWQRKAYRKLSIAVLKSALSDCRINSMQGEVMRFCKSRISEVFCDVADVDYQAFVDKCREAIEKT